MRRCNLGGRQRVDYSSSAKNQANAFAMGAFDEPPLDFCRFVEQRQQRTTPNAFVGGSDGQFVIAKQFLGLS
jgi:hypothetical protein